MQQKFPSVKYRLHVTTYYAMGTVVPRIRRQSQMFICLQQNYGFSMGELKLQRYNIQITNIVFTFSFFLFFQKSSNPGFLNTISFRASDGLTCDSRIRFTVFDVRERVSHTAVPIGSACVLLSAIQDSSRLRIPLVSRNQSTVGFLSISTWALEAEDRGSSTEHTPCRAPSHNNAQVGHICNLLLLCLC